MLPRQAIRELCVAAAVFLLFWSGVAEAVIRASWSPLRQTRIFAILCCAAVAALVYLWAASRRRPVGGERVDEDDEPGGASYSSRR